MLHVLQHEIEVIFVLEGGFEPDDPLAFYPRENQPFEVDLVTRVMSSQIKFIDFFQGVMSQGFFVLRQVNRAESPLSNLPDYPVVPEVLLFHIIFV